MLITVACSLIYLEISRSAIQLSPKNVKEFWNEHELRMMVLLSLSQQIILIIFGSRRMYMAGAWISFLLWITYLLADSVATTSLGLLSKQQGETAQSTLDRSTVTRLRAFWAPFLLLHLGGPDTITAYSLEDNDLWLRHLLGLLYQVGIAFYVFYVSWHNDALAYITILVFVAGLVKYTERTWVLRSSSSDNFTKTSLFLFNPARHYNEFLREESSSRKTGQDKHFSSEVSILQEAYYFFMMFIYFMADVIVNFSEMQDGFSIISKKPGALAFKPVEVELGFLYDVIYTKATIAHSSIGFFLRSVSFLSSMSALILFVVIVDKHHYSSIDVGITYSLLVGAIVLEIYAVVLLIFSDWTLFWFADRYHSQPNRISRAICSLRSLAFSKGKRWSEQISQLDLISLCLKSDAGKCLGIDFFSFGAHLKEKWYMTGVKVNDKMKELIVIQLLDKHSRVVSSMYDTDVFRQIMDGRGDYILQSKSALDMLWSIRDYEYDESFFIWHIATDLCYYDDLNENNYQEAKNPRSSCKISKFFSDYMLYILIMCPAMLPKGSAEKLYRVTCDEFLEFCDEFRIPRTVNLATKELLQKPQGRLVQSIVSDASKLAKSLQQRVSEGKWSREEKWETISCVWVEMLGYTASRCEWKQHAKQLAHGGELISHISFLMMHLNLYEQFKLLRRYPREKKKTKKKSFLAKMGRCSCLPKQT